MSDGDALLRAILLNPAEDTPRLMYADWLQENGEEDRAEFIRLQCGLFGPPLWTRQQVFLHCEQIISRNAQGHKWAAVPNCGFGYVQLIDDATEFVGKSEQRGVAKFARGFVAEVEMPLVGFLDHAKALFSAHPIERVTLTDMRPSPWATDDERPEWTYFIGTVNTGYHLPQEIYFRLAGQWRHSREAALKALSPACVAYGRFLAGLSPTVTA